jgi:hypothetical protein
MNSLLVDLSEMARQVSAQLDNRARKLQILMEEADKKIERLSILAGKTVQHEEPAAQLRITPAEPDPPAAPADLPPSPAITQRHGEIYLLADEGKTPMQIATLLNRPRGEIELILALRPRKKAQE